MNESLENILSTSVKKEEMVKFLEMHPEKFDEVISIAISNNQPQAWRAAWLLNHYLKDNGKRIKFYINDIIRVIPSKKDGHQRELLKILNKIYLTERQIGKVFDICMTIWESINKSPSVRGNAFAFIAKTVEKYPELKVEIEHLSQNHYTETLSPGIKHSLNKLFDELNLN